MSDLIDRQAAIDEIERNAYRHTYLDQIMHIINCVPSAESRWIPVTERLPEPNEIEENGCRRYYLTQDEYGDMMVCSWNGFKWEQIYQLEPTDGEIVAWMPLPEPWRGEVR